MYSVDAAALCYARQQKLRLNLTEVSMDLTDINSLFNYTEWANNLVLDVAANLADDNLRRDVGISHQSIFGTLLHMAGAEWLWLERWYGRSPAKAELLRLPIVAVTSCSDPPRLTPILTD